MALTDKIIAALSKALKIEYIRLDADDGISGFIVSSQFVDMSSLDRQALIEDTLQAELTPAERRRIVMIAGLTPAEYDEVGARITVHKINELANGKVEVQVQGGVSDAEYVRGALKSVKGVKTNQPRQVPGAVGVLMSFQATGTEASPLTKTKAIHLLQNDPYISLMPST